MNMLLGGYFMSEEGDTLSAKQIALTGCLVAIITTPTNKNTNLKTCRILNCMRQK